MRYLVVLFFAALSLNAVGQTFQVDVNEIFSMPDHLAIDQSSDYLNLTGILNSSFNREGFNVVNANWARNQLKRPKKKTNYQEIALEVFHVLERSSSVDPSLNTIKRYKLVKLAINAGIPSLSINKGIDECVKQGALVVLPKNMIAISTSRNPPLVEAFEGEEWTPPIIYYFEFNYIYRDSFTCGRTIKEFYASLNDMSDGSQLASIKFEQPALSSMCKQEIINKCVSKLMDKNHHDFKFQKNKSYVDITSITVLGKSGKDCRGKGAAALANDFSNSILKLYNVVDRDNLDIFLKEHKNSMTGLFEESDYIEAGKLAGAEGVIFVSATCVNKHTEIDVSLSDTKTGSIQWSIHSENLDPHEIADRFIESVIED